MGDWGRSPQRGLGRSPTGDLGAEPQAGFGAEPQSGSEDGAPSNRKLKLFGILESSVTVITYRMQDENPWNRCFRWIPVSGQLVWKDKIYLVICLLNKDLSEV